VKLIVFPKVASRGALRPESVILALAAAAFFWTMPKAGEFWWSEAPRNALNGAFVLDLLLAAPLSNPVAWAYDYYLRYPALTILFYPPLLHVVLGGVFLLFGVSHAAAAACIAAFAFAFATGVHALARRVCDAPAALAVAMLALAAPQVLTWGRQIMLELPMLAFMVWAAVWSLRYAEESRPRQLVFATALMLCALYTKQTSFVIVPAVAAMLLGMHGASLLKRPHVWVVGLASALALLPLVLLQVRFGSFNVTSVVDRPDMPLDRASWESVGWYGIRLFGMFGVLAPLALVACLRGFSREKLRKPDLLLHTLSLAISYAVLTSIALKEERHGMVLIVPVVGLAAVALGAISDALAQPMLSRAISVSLSLLAATMLLRTPPPIVTGYPDAAEFVVRRLPPGGRVMFVGNRDGAFIFNVRERSTATSATVVRADKLFLGIQIMPDLGLNEKRMAREQVARMMTDLGISYVVTVPNMWIEAEVMRHLSDVLASDQFERLASFPVTGNAEEKELVVYLNKQPLPATPAPLSAELGAVGLSIRR
jgi:hypothetical protein